MSAAIRAGELAPGDRRRGGARWGGTGWTRCAEANPRLSRFRTCLYESLTSRCNGLFGQAVFGRAAGLPRLWPRGVRVPVRPRPKNSLKPQTWWAWVEPAADRSSTGEPAGMPGRPVPGTRQHRPALRPRPAHRHLPGARLPEAGHRPALSVPDIPTVPRRDLRVLCGTAPMRCLCDGPLPSCAPQRTAHDPPLPGTRERRISA